MRFHLKVVLGLSLVVGAALAVIFLLSGGEEAAIEAILKDAASAAGRGDADAIVAIVSRDYRAGDEDFEAVSRRIRAEVTPRRYEAVELAGLAVHAAGGEATARVRVRVRAANFGAGEAGFELHLRKEGESWRITSAREIR